VHCKGNLNLQVKNQVTSPKFRFLKSTFDRVKVFSHFLVISSLLRKESALQCEIHSENRYVKLFFVDFSTFFRKSSERLSVKALILVSNFKLKLNLISLKFQISGVVTLCNQSKKQCFRVA